MPESKPKRRWFPLIFGTLLFLAVLFACGLYLETFYADSGAVRSVRKGMTYAEVVELLGAMYDRSYRGEYESSDKIMAEMEDGNAIDYVCGWRIGFSRDKFYVGFDKNDIAKDTVSRR